MDTSSQGCTLMKWNVSLNTFWKQCFFHTEPVPGFLAPSAGCASGAAKTSWGGCFGRVEGPGNPFHSPETSPPCSGRRHSSLIWQFSTRGRHQVWSNASFPCFPCFWTVWKGTHLLGNRSMCVVGVEDLGYLYRHAGSACILKFHHSFNVCLG